MFFITAVIHDFSKPVETMECVKLGFFLTQAEAERLVKKENEALSYPFIYYMTLNNMDRFDDFGETKMYIIIEKVNPGLVENAVWRKVYEYDPEWGDLGEVEPPFFCKDKEPFAMR